MHREPLCSTPGDFNIEPVAQVGEDVPHSETDRGCHHSTVCETQLSNDRSQVDDMMRRFWQLEHGREDDRDQGRGKDPFARYGDITRFFLARSGLAPEDIEQTEVRQLEQELCTFDPVDFVDGEDVQDHRLHHPSVWRRRVGDSSVCQPDLASKGESADQSFSLERTGQTRSTLCFGRYGNLGKIVKIHDPRVLRIPHKSSSGLWHPGDLHEPSVLSHPEGREDVVELIGFRSDVPACNLGRKEKRIVQSPRLLSRGHATRDDRDDLVHGLFI